MRRATILMVLCAIFAVAFSASVEMESMTDLQHAAELAMMDNGNGAWFVRVFEANSTENVTPKGPFSYVGLEPVQNKTVPTLNKEAVIKSILTTGNPNPVGALQTPTLVRAKVLRKPAVNPLLPFDYKAPIVEIDAEYKKKLQPAVVLGIPDKHLNREAYKEWKKNQESFGYLGLRKVATQKALVNGTVTVKTRRNKTRVMTSTRVINSREFDDSVKPISAQKLNKLKVLPTILEGVVAAPEAPVYSLNAPIVAVPLPYYHDARDPNVAAAVPGATAGVAFPVQAAFVESSDMITPMSYEDSERLAADAQENAWSTLHAGVSNLMDEHVNSHEASVAQLSQMSVDLANALGVDASLLSIGESVNMDSEINAEVVEHHDLAAEHDIPAQFNFVRNARVLDNSVNVLEAEHDDLHSQLEDKISFIEKAMTESGVAVEADTEDRSEMDAKAATEAETEAEAETETETEAEAETESTDAQNYPIVHSPAARYYRTRLAQVGAPRFSPRFARRVWSRIHGYPQTAVTVGSTFVNPHPYAVRVLAERLRNIRTKLRAYRRVKGLQVRNLAYKVQKFLNKLARASVVERRIVAKALATRPIDYRRSERHTSLRKLIRKYKKSSKKADRAAKKGKKADKKSSKKAKKAVKKASKAVAKKVAKALKSSNKKDAKKIIKKAVKKAAKAVKKSIKKLTNVKSAAKAIPAVTPKAVAAKESVKAAVSKLASQNNIVKAAIAKAQANPANSTLSSKAIDLIAEQSKAKDAAAAAIAKAKNVTTTEIQKKIDAAKVIAAQAPNNATAQARIAELKNKKVAAKAALKQTEKVVKADTKKVSVAASTAAIAVAAPAQDSAEVTALKNKVASLQSLVKSLEAKKAKKSKKASKIAKAVAKAVKAVKAANATKVAKAVKAVKAVAKAIKAVKVANATKVVKAVKAVDTKTACANALARVNACKAGKVTGAKCDRANKAVALPACQAATFVEVDVEADMEAEIMTEVEAETEAEAEAETETEAEAETEVDADAEFEAELDDVFGSKANAEVNVDDAESVTRDITQLAASALAEEASHVKNAFQQKMEQLPTTPSYRGGSSAGILAQRTTTAIPQDSLSQIAEELASQ